MKKRYIAMTIAFVVAMLGIGVLWILITITNNILPHGETAATSSRIIPLPLATDIEAGINQYRTSQGLPVLNSEVAALDQAAAARAEQMCAANDWSHARDWEILAPHYAWAYAGENLYYGYSQENQAAVAVQAWINSPTHHANMVGNYSEMGIAVKACPGFQNEPTAVIVTNYFGVPR